MKSALIALLMLGFATLSFAASGRGYTMDVPAAEARSITFDVQEGDLIIRGDPAATSVHMRVSIDRYWLFKLGEDGILKRLIKVSGEGTRVVPLDVPGMRAARHLVLLRVVQAS